jgi:DNA-binding transcriptional LysR family regulator
MTNFDGSSLARTGRISLRHLRAFLCVAEHQNFTRAASHLNVAQSALTRTIQHLEEDLGLKLFVRMARHVELTSAGQEFLPTAWRLVREFGAALDEMRALGNMKRGKVGVAAVPSLMALLLPQAVSAYVERLPEVDLYLREDNSAAVQQRVLDEEVDLGLAGPLGDVSGLELTPLLKDRFGVVCSKDHPLALAKRPVRWSDLASFRIIGFAADLGMQRLLEDTSGVPEKVKAPRYRVSNTSAVESLVSRGLGVSVMSALAAKRPPLTELAWRPLVEPGLDRTVCLMTKRGRALTSAAAAFLEPVMAALADLERHEGVSILMPPLAAALRGRSSA